ncbi:hypothetical protein VP01_7354g1, partial [Puccinia sorghi]
DSAGIIADGSHVSFDVQSGEVEQAVEAGLHTDTVLCLLGYVQMGIGDHQVWEIIERGTMVKLLPTDLFRNANLGSLAGFVSAWRSVKGGNGGWR